MTWLVQHENHYMEKICDCYLSVQLQKQIHYWKLFLCYTSKKWKHLRLRANCQKALDSWWLNNEMNKIRSHNRMSRIIQCSPWFISSVAHCENVNVISFAKLYLLNYSLTLMLNAERVTFQIPILINKQGRHAQHGELDAVWKPEFCSLLWKLVSWAWSQKKPCHTVKKFPNWMPAVLPGPEWPNVMGMNDEVVLFYKTFQMASVQRVILWGLWPSKIFIIVASIKIKGENFFFCTFCDIVIPQFGHFVKVSSI